MENNFDLIVLGVDRQQVEGNDISDIEKVFTEILKRDNDEVRYLKGRFTIAVSGYNKDTREFFSD